MNKKRMASLFAGLATVVTVGMLSVAPANAATSASSSDTVYGCPRGYFCIYENAYWNSSKPGLMAKFQVGDANLNDSNGPRGMANKTSSYINNTYSAWTIYKNPIGSRGDGRAVKPMEAGSFTGGWNNEIESLHKGR